MTENNDRHELQRRLEQARRMAADHHDPLTKERLGLLIRYLEEQLGDPGTTVPVGNLSQS